MQRYPLANRTIIKTKNLTLVSDLAPVVSGHLLAVTNGHFLSSQQASQELDEDISGTIHSWLNSYSQYFPDYVWMEHGSAIASSNGSCIDHAHIHFFPKWREEATTLIESDLKGSGVELLWEDYWNIRIRTPYFAYGDLTSVRLFSSPRLPSRQYARSVLARLRGLSAEAEWDWGVVAVDANIQRTLELVRPIY